MESILPIDSSNINLRSNCSSSRSIKRKRFDDEIVEYSLGLPPAQVSRVVRSRTHSQTVASTASVTAVQPTPPIQTSAYTFPEPVAATSTVTARVTSPSIETPSIDVNALAANTSPTIPATIVVPTSPSVVVPPAPEPSKPVSAKSIQASAKSTSAKSISAKATPAKSTPAKSAAVKAAPVKTAPVKTPQSSAKLAQPQQVPIQTFTNPLATAAAERRRSMKSITGGKKSKKSRGGQQLTTKDLGRWKPIDDLSLIVGIQQTNDLRTVHQGVKFSCKFTIQEMQSRWYSLLYDEPISRIAVAAMRNLHPELVESVHSKALYTTQEEELLGTIKSVSLTCHSPQETRNIIMNFLFRQTEAPSLDKFQELLDKNALVFYPARTPKALFNHWNLMKQYMLLPDQQINPIRNSSSFSCLPDGDFNVHFSDQEDKINDHDLNDARDEALELELALADRKSKKEIRHLENELPKWTVLVDSITGIGIHPEFDNSTLAVLRGRLVRYLMRSREVRRCFICCLLSVLTNFFGVSDHIGTQIGP